MVGNLGEVHDRVNESGASTALALHAPEGINAGDGAEERQSAGRLDKNHDEVQFEVDLSFETEGKSEADM